MFHVKPKNKEINWKILGGATPEKIQLGINTNEIHELVEMITYCNVDKEDFQDLNLIKLFKLSQIINEYLINNNEILISKNKELEKNKAELETNLLNLKNNKHLQGHDNEEIKKENKMLKKTVYAYQMAHKLPAGQVTSYYKCDFCSKSFTSDNFLESHVKRRHSDCLSEFYDSRGDFKSKRTDPLLEKITEALAVMSTQINNTDQQVRELYSQQEREKDEKSRFDFEQKMVEEREKWFQQWDDMKKDIVNEIKDHESVKILDDKPEYEELRDEVNQLKKALKSKNVKVGASLETVSSKKSRSSSKNNDSQSLKSIQDILKTTKMSRTTSTPKLKNVVSAVLKRAEEPLDDIQEQPEEYSNHDQNPEIQERQERERIGWEDYQNIMQNEVFSPLGAKPWVKSFFKHSESQVIDEKPVLLRDINKNIGGKEAFDLDNSRTFFNEMKNHLSEQLEFMTSQKKFKSTKPQLQIDTNSPKYEQRDSGNATGTFSRPQSPNKRISWRDYRGAGPITSATLSRVASPLKNLDDEEWSDDELDSPIFKTLSLNRPKLYQSFKNKEADARHIAGSMSPAVPKANPFIVAKAATQFKGLLRKKEGYSNSPLTPSDGIFNRAQSPLQPVPEEDSSPRIFDRKNLFERDQAPPSNNFDSIFAKPSTKLTTQPIEQKQQYSPNPAPRNLNQTRLQTGNVKKVVVDEDRFESDQDEF